MALTPEQLIDLAALVGAEHVRYADELAVLDPGVDPHNLGGDLWLRPKDTDEVVAILRYCHTKHISVVPQGGRTGLSGGATSRPGDVILSLERLNTLTLDPISRTAVVGAGVKLAVLAEAAAAVGLSPGIDLGARDSATIGGMVSTNAGGIAAFRHGTLRERVLGLEAVLADGRVLSELGQVVKRNEGLAVERLLIGAEGTLGIITSVALSLVPLDPDLVLVELSATTDEAAQAALLGLLETAAETDIALDAALAQNETQRAHFWRVREDWAVDRERPGGLWYDISVPLSRLSTYVDDVTERLQKYDAQLDLYLIGHLADGNLHVTVNATRPITERYDEIAAVVTQGLTALGGSFSAEHGIGVEKKATLERGIDPTKRDLMRSIKHLMDPHGILNPGKVIPN